jgi:hypothetical protein
MGASLSDPLELAHMIDPLKQLQRTIAIDIGRFQSAGLPPKAIVTKLMEIPEVDQALHLYANRRRPLSLDPSTDADKQEIVDAIERVAAWLDDGFHEPLVEQLREIGGELSAE